MAACVRQIVHTVPHKVRNCSCVINRLYSHHNSVKKTKKYTSSVILPNTAFPPRHDSKTRTETDELLYKKCGFSSLYCWQRENATGQEFILHDGPPYANGSPHMGHAINKILKDITIRHKLLQGFQIHYVPGWDCHGLPIELKALGNAKGLSTIEIRQKAREYAKEAIANQRNIFRSWGIMADWEENCYFTFDKEYIKNQLHQFYKLFERGLVYRDMKPVFWSPSSRTALAEAELEYNPSHRSSALTFRLRLASLSADLASGTDQVFALVWTTTPWTLPANQAVCFNPDVEYSLVRINGSHEKYIVATNLIEYLKEKLDKSMETLSTFPASVLCGSTYHHPLTPEIILPMLAADHVTTDKGTGLVHTAPAHGPDDFLVALEHNMQVQCLVDEDGCYTEHTIPRLHGLPVLGEGNRVVLELLEGDVVHLEDYVHSYPYDWRTKQPVILRASRQWFVDTAAIKHTAVEELKAVKMYPERGSGSGALSTQLERRPYWCISRQRAWGVPIPVLYRTSTLQPVVSPATIARYCELIDLHGTDFWWTLSVEQLLTADILAEQGARAEDLEKGADILDIWFDSGISWSSVLGQDKVADVCVEGVDQFTGWFQSALMTSVALRGFTPYKALLTHGFAVDQHGRKMSKSEGNVVDPQEVTRGGGGKDGKKWPAYGVDVLRWWVACHATQHSTVPVSRPVIQASSESVQKIRVVLRFLLGVLGDPSPPPATPPPLRTLDRYLLHLLYHFHAQVTLAYDTYQFNRACSLITHFVTTDVSALYCHVVKDRLYCDARDSAARQACLLVTRHILQTVVRAIAPILPFLAEEVYLYHPCKQSETLFRSGVVAPSEDWNRPDISRVMDVALDVKRLLNQSASIANTLELNATVFADTETISALQLFQDLELTELFQVASVHLVSNEGNEPTRVETVKTQQWQCARCRHFSTNCDSDLCSRCQQVFDASLADL